MTATSVDDRAIFEVARNIGSPEARREYLDQICGHDAPQRQRIDALLAAHDQHPSFLEAPPGALADSPTFDFASGESAGSQIGPYKLLEKIGEGGMGLVYMAEQQQPVRRLVALKLLKPGLDTSQVIARFEAERQALAMMDHPHIARIFDAGTVGEGKDEGRRRKDGRKDEGRRQKDEGDAPLSSFSFHPSSFAAARPYFVMELVRGIPINEFCAHKKLTVRQRLELFIQVCQAVQHAHQKGIIHRDLKPTNVLVTMHDVQPVPKVIDFGIAKALGQSLTDHTLYTGFTQLVGTPLYMSPEQAEMNQLGVDTRSDVYSLGVLLYELLTGTTPFDAARLKSAGFDEMRRIIREEEPETVSQRLARTRSQLRIADCGLRISGINPQSEIRNPQLAELDWIVMKALEKDRSHRYESASALAADIQRYLADEPVLACPPTAMYRFQKFARKHKASLTTAAAIAVCLLLGTTVSAWQALRATAAEGQANANAAAAQASAQQAQDKAQEANEQRNEAQRQRDEVKALYEKLAAKDEELQQTLYVDHIRMAQMRWDSGSVSALKGLLNQHVPKAGEPDRRGFEWHYLNRLANIGPVVSIKTRLLLSSNVAITPDRTRFVAYYGSAMQFINGERVQSGPSLNIWNLQTGEEEFAVELSGAADLAGPSTSYNRPFFSPDASLICINSSFWDAKEQVYTSGKLKVWDTRSGREILALSGIIEDAEFSPDSRLLATTRGDQTIALWDMETGQQRRLLEGKIDMPHGLIFSRDGKRLAAAGNTWDKAKKDAVAGEIRIWEVETGRQLQTLAGHPKFIDKLMFRPDGQQLASSAEKTGAVKLWDINSGKELFALPLDVEFHSQLEFNADGTRLLTAGFVDEQGEFTSYTKLWNVETGRAVLSFQNAGLEFSPDGRRIAAADWKNSRTKVFDAKSGQIMLSLTGAGGKLAFSADSKRLATDCGGRQASDMRIWDLEAGDDVNHIKGFSGGMVLAFSADGKRLIGGSGSEIQVWDAEVEQQTGKTLVLRGVGRQSHRRGSTTAVISADFSRIAGISYDRVKVFDAATGQEQWTLDGLKRNVISVAISPDGKRVAASDGQQYTYEGKPNPGVVKVWDADTGSEVFSIATLDPAVANLRFSPDGKKLAGSSSDRIVHVWDAQSGRELRTLGEKGQRMNNAFCLFAFSPDGKRIAGPGQIWDAESGEALVTLGRTMNGVIDCVAFSPDGKRILCGSGRGHGAFDAQTGKELYNIPVGNMAWPSFSPDGKRLASGNTIFNAQTGQPLLNLPGQDMSGQVAFSADGHRLAIVKAMSNEVTIYDATPLPEKP